MVIFYDRIIPFPQRKRKNAYLAARATKNRGLLSSRPQFHFV